MNSYMFFCILIFLFNISSFLHITIHTIIYIHVQKTTRKLQVQETLYLVRILNYNFQRTHDLCTGIAEVMGSIPVQA